MKAVKKYGAIIAALCVLGGILYLNKFSSVTKVVQGKKLYTKHCSNCHGGEGEGLRRLIPPLAGADYVENNFTGLPCIIRNGINGEIVVNGQSFNQPMVGIQDLEIDEIKSIMDFMIVEWYPNQKSMSHAEISSILDACD